MSFIKNRYYFYDFFKEDKNIPHFYRSIVNVSSETVLHNYYIRNKIGDNAIRKVNHIPDYLSVDYNHNLIIKSINRDIGYAIKLDDAINVDAYVNNHFKKANRITNAIKRLERSFNITYKRYYGDISENSYAELLQCLFQMVEKRFNQLGKINKQITSSQWQRTLNDTLSLIKNKRASLFVIYDDYKPILISISHHWKDVFYGVMCSFDIDYSKFGLGHIHLYKQVEWCIDNGYKTFDVGPGEYHYKKRWSNHTYTLLQHVIYKKGHLSHILIANAEIISTKIKKYIISKRFLPSLKLLPNKLNDDKNKYLNSLTKFVEHQDFDIEEYAMVDYRDDEYAFLRKIVYDYLYTKSEQKSDVEVFKITCSNKFLIRGKYSSMIYSINDL